LKVRRDAIIRFFGARAVPMRGAIVAGIKNVARGTESC